MSNYTVIRSDEDGKWYVYNESGHLTSLCNSYEEVVMYFSRVSSFLNCRRAVLTKTAKAGVFIVLFK